jgi:hypothetical protein
MTSRSIGRSLRRVAVCSSLFIANFVLAAPLDKKDVPAGIKDWIPWALHDAGDRQCPFLYNNGELRQCSWPSRLTILARDRGATFSQEVSVFRTVWIPLPGDAKHWPLDVRVSGKPMPIIAVEERPGVRLSPGRQLISGAFSWSELPENLPMPAAVGLVALIVNGKSIPSPTIDEAGRLWLNTTSGGESGAERLDMRVSRLVTDDIPTILTTHIELVASGKSREVLLPHVLLADFVPLSLNSPLPARLEADGALRLQIRPGRWTIRTTGRHMTPVRILTLPAQRDSLATGDEAWAFEARTQNRLVTIEGVPTVDPQQTTLPQEWKQFPAFLLRPGDTMRLNETKRGDPDPAPDQLTLERNLWLDFNGGGFTVQDRIVGTVSRSWRLEMAPPQKLGRVTVDGVAQYITRLASGGPAGIELRRGQADITAESRIDQSVRTFSATGWGNDFNRLSATLHLPPGWRLIHASGVDRAPDSWWERWTLLDLFLVLIIAVAAHRLFGWRWGAVAFLALLLSYHEAGAPTWAWLNLLLAAALFRVLPAGRARHVIGVYRLLAMLLVALLLIPFFVSQIRQAIYPALERPWQVVLTEQTASATGSPVAPKPVAMERAKAGAVSEAEGVPAQNESPPPPAALGYVSGGKPAGAITAPEGRPEKIWGYTSGSSRRLSSLDQMDPNTKIQTGPGLPSWQWNVLHLGWSGPVEHTQKIRLWLVSPGIEVLLVVMRLAFLLLLLARLARSTKDEFHSPRAPVTATVVGAALILMALAAPPARAAEIPSPELIKELREKLLAPPDCLPRCADISRLRILASPNSLQLRLEAHADADTAIPLPCGAQQWLPNQVLVDGAPAAGLLRDGSGGLWLQLAKGVHQVTMEGSLAARDTVQLPFPLRPRHVDAELQGFTLDGLGADGEPRESVLLTRVSRHSGSTAEEPAGGLPPFVRVERTLQLGLSWQIETRVSRAGPSSAPVLVAVPLLEGESVTQGEVPVEKGAALVNLGPQTNEFVFGSALKEQAALVLHAPAASAQIQVWRLNLGPQWHATLGGIPVVSQLDEGARWLPEWHPWPGEKVTLALEKPAGTDGQTLTLDGSALTVAPGIRATDSTLTMRLRASRGGQQLVRLPEGAVLQRVEIDGQTQPIRLEGREIKLPIHPGTQTVSTVWREPRGMGTRFTTSAIDVGTRGVNGSLEVSLPEGRWLLFVGGPRLGPAVLIWGVVIALALIAYGLARVPLTPLGTGHWFLLALGLTQAPLQIGVIIAGWFFFSGLRKRFSAEFVKSGLFHLGQITLAVWTIAALVSLFVAVERGLLGHPDMQVAGNGSSNLLLRWYQDRTMAVLPTAWVISIPLLAYRVLMLAWALWLAYSLITWLRWGWECFSKGGYWRKVGLPSLRRSEKTSPPTPVAESSGGGA